MNRLNVLQTVLILSVFCPACCSFAQTLDVSQKEKVQTKILLSGKIVEQKKYSFTMQHKDKTYTVKVPRGTPVFTRLKKPVFDLIKGQVAVQVPTKSTGKPNSAATGTVASDQKKETDESADKWVRFSLPQPLYLVTQFNHQQQKERLLGADVLRVNNYTLQPGKPVPAPTVPNQPNLELGGQVVWNTPKKIFLKYGEKRKKLVLGHRNATLTGLSVATLPSKNVRLKVQGNLQQDGSTVEATTVEVIVQE